MSMNRVGWAKLKEAKRRTKHSVDEDFYSLEDKFLNKELHMRTKEKADKHLSNLHLLLGKMPSLERHDFMISKNFARLNEKANTALMNHDGAYKPSKTR